MNEYWSGPKPEYVKWQISLNDSLDPRKNKKWHKVHSILTNKTVCNLGVGKFKTWVAHFAIPPVDMCKKCLEAVERAL
jgi:hypothetical protein|tara:strand:+ start:268 stop:501 length:234 start_codon:yes stop_codon:yes gene_type:complete